MQEHDEKEMLEAFEKKLSQANREDLLRLIFTQLKQIQLLKECDATGTRLAIKHHHDFEELRKQSNDYAEQLLKIHNLLNKEGFLYPDTSLEDCIQGMICDLDYYKGSNLKDEQKSNT